MNLKQGVNQINQKRRSKMKPKQLAGLSAVFPFLWAGFGRLPGPPTGEYGVLPSQAFECTFKEAKDKGFVQVQTEAVEFTWLSEDIRGITMQEVEYCNGDYYAREESPAKSLVRVEMISYNTACLYDLDPEIEYRLLQGVGYFSLVTAYLDRSRNELVKDREMVVEGDGRGAWTVQKE